MRHSQVRAKLRTIWSHIPAKYVTKLMTHDWEDRPGHAPHKSAFCKRCDTMILLDEDASNCGRGEEAGLWAYQTKGGWIFTNLAVSEFKCGWAQERIFSCNETLMKRVLAP